MARRSKAYASRSRRRCLPTSCPNYSQTASDTLDPADMVMKADKVSPRKGVDETPTNLADARQKSEKLAVAWTTQIYKRVVEVGETAEEFLEQFAPGKAKLRTACPVPKFPCKVPARAGSETRMYGPLVRHSYLTFIPRANRGTLHRRSPVYRSLCRISPRVTDRPSRITRTK